MLAQYLPARYGIPILIAIVILAGWNLGYMDFHSWHILFVLAVSALVIWRISLVLNWLRKRKKASLITDELNMEVPRAFYSGTKTGMISGITKASYFIVNVELALHIKKPNIHLSWIRLYIAGKYLEPIKSLPPLRDEMKHQEEAYELIFEVPVKTFLKGRYSIDSIRPDKANPDAQIYVKANGRDWYSKPFAILAQKVIIE